MSDRWESDATGLPTRRVPQPGIDADVAHLGFDHCFEGWRGAARIRDERFSLQLTSSLDRLVVFYPGNRPYDLGERVHVEPFATLADTTATEAALYG